MTAEMFPIPHDVGTRFNDGSTFFGTLSVTRSTKLGTVPERQCTRCVRAWVPLLLSPEPEKVHYVYYSLWIGNEA
jgi:hypothetical protein